MSRRRKPGPTRKGGGWTQYRDLTGSQLQAVLDAMGGVGDQGDDDHDCPICRAVGIRVNDDGSISER